MTLRSFVLVVIALSAVSVDASAQDTIKVMSWNLLGYNNSSAQTRNQYYRTVLRHVQPDVLVVEEMISQAAVDSFYNKVVNLVFPGQFAKGTYVVDPHDTGNEIYYRTSKFQFVSNMPVHTVLRDISEFKLYSPYAADTIRLYAVHLKASSGFESDRAAEVDSLRAVTNALPAGRYFMVMGDFNIYASTEPAYTKMLQDNPTDDGHFLDALTMPGTWNNGSYAAYHTQSTRVRALPDGGSTGGMDDRFDMILYSRGLTLPGRIRYVPGSLTNIGNDGNHYNDSLNAMPNTAAPDSVIDALYYASDHLPVSVRLALTPAQPTFALLTKLYLRDHGGENDSLDWGIAAGATDGMDTWFGEYEMPPLPPSGIFDARWRITGLQGMRRDIKDTLGGTHQQNVYYGLLQPGGGGYPFVLKWNRSLLPAGYFILRDNLGGSVFVVDMKQQDSLVISDENVVSFQIVYSLGATTSTVASAGWNMLSVPVTVSDLRKTVVFPGSASQAFAYTPAGYVIRDTLAYGRGYWLKYTTSQTVSLTGGVRALDTIAVTTGWNMIGSISSTALVANITQVPSGIVVSSYFGYSGSYVAATSILPERSYWVKVNQPGLLILH